MGNITETSVFENMNQFDTSFNETIYNSSYMIGVSEVGSNVREISLLALLDEGGALTNNDGTRISQNEIDEISDIAVVWGYVETNPFLQYGQIVVQQIYNHETGEVYWENHDDAINWNDGDELILNSLLMYGDLESTII